MADRLKVEISHTVHVSEVPAPGSGWRGRFGMWLRRLASRMDGDRSLRLRVEAQPALTSEVAASCIAAGIRHGSKLIHEACRAEAMEEALRTYAPRLYADETHDQEVDQ